MPLRLGVGRAAQHCDARVDRRRLFSHSPARLRAPRQIVQRVHRRGLRAAAALANQSHQRSDATRVHDCSLPTCPNGHAPDATQLTLGRCGVALARPAQSLQRRGGGLLLLRVAAAQPCNQWSHGPRANHCRQCVGLARQMAQHAGRSGRRRDRGPAGERHQRLHRDGVEHGGLRVALWREGREQRDRLLVRVRMATAQQLDERRDARNDGGAARVARAREPLQRRARRAHLDLVDAVDAVDAVVARHAAQQERHRRRLGRHARRQLVREQQHGRHRVRRATPRRLRQPHQRRQQLLDARRRQPSRQLAQRVGRGDVRGRRGLRRRRLLLLLLLLSRPAVAKDRVQRVQRSLALAGTAAQRRRRRELDRRRDARHDEAGEASDGAVRDEQPPVGRVPGRQRAQCGGGGELLWPRVAGEVLRRQHPHERRQGARIGHRALVGLVPTREAREGRGRLEPRRPRLPAHQPHERSDAARVGDGGLVGLGARQRAKQARRVLLGLDAAAVGGLDERRDGTLSHNGRGEVGVLLQQRAQLASRALLLLAERRPDRAHQRLGAAGQRLLLHRAARALRPRRSRDRPCLPARIGQARRAQQHGQGERALGALGASAPEERLEEVEQRLEQVELRCRRRGRPRLRRRLGPRGGPGEAADAAGGSAASAARRPAALGGRPDAVGSDLVRRRALRRWRCTLAEGRALHGDAKAEVGADHLSVLRDEVERVSGGGWD